MDIDDIRTLYAYNVWANRRILSTAAAISDEQFAAPAPGGYGSLRGVLAHTLDTEAAWRTLCQHGSLAGFSDIDEAAVPSVAELARRWAEDEQAMRVYLARLSDADLTGYVRYTTPSGIRRERLLWHGLVHIVNHGTQHRADAAAILTSYGASPGDLDFTLFLNERT